MINKKCPACWKDIPLQASKCPYCHTEQPEPTKKEWKVGAIVCLLLAVGLFVAALFLYNNPPTKTISNPRWNVIKYSAGTEQEEPMYIKREDYTLPTCLAIGGGVFIFCTGLMFWVSKD